ncbi:hypothetical protein KL86DPRO_20605 [uncultured delta proteobacterium]|uniref:Uncharacterized protein n=1 Tax=uncultured delta proteobacterium TaxID=34034 RepID=A0A212K2Y8_9DELT|nr:hypothetical protein KL86DPRO_20605 [uncultured delta proteobacterium]
MFESRKSVTRHNKTLANNNESLYIKYVYKYSMERFNNPCIIRNDYDTVCQRYTIAAASACGKTAMRDSYRESALFTQPPFMLGEF